MVSLPDELWGVIGSKLATPSDRLRFRAVSKTWKSLLPFRQPPWLMLAESQTNDGDTNGEERTLLDTPPPPPPPRGFVSLGEEENGNIYQIAFPEIHQARCVGSTGNWLATIHLDRTIRLLNPFTMLQFSLPSVSTLEHQFYTESGDEQVPPEIYRDHLIHKIALSSPPTDPGCIAVTLYYYYKVLSFARPGDPSWSSIPVTNESDPQVIGIADMIFYNNMLYAITLEARLMVCDIHEDDAPKLSYITEPLTNYCSQELKYLVECAGELLLVIKFVHTNFNPEEKKEDDPFYITTKFKVYKLDFDSMKFDELTSLGEHSLFLGFNTSISLFAPDYHGFVKRNCIYFTDDFTFGYRGSGTDGGHDMGVFNMEDNSITPHFKGLSTSLYSPPVWIVPA